MYHRRKFCLFLNLIFGTTVMKIYVNFKELLISRIGLNEHIDCIIFNVIVLLCYILKV